MATYKIVDSGHLDILDDDGKWITRVHICGGDTAQMKPAAMQEMADFAERLSRTKRPTTNAATTRGEGCSECGGVIAHVGGTLCEAHTIITGPWESTTRGEG